MAEFFGILAFILLIALGLLVAFFFLTRQNLENAQQALQSVQEESSRLRQQNHSLLARYQPIADLDKHKAALEVQINKARAILPQFHHLFEMEQHKQQLTKTVAQLEQADRQWRERISGHESTLASLTAQMQSVEEAVDMQSFGFYRPKYGFEDSQQYAHRLDTNRENQASLVKADTATHCPNQWTVDGSEAKGRKMVKNHGKLMLRAFNGECDATMAKVKYNNANNLETRINRSFEAINKLGDSEQLAITHEYLNLKLQELYLVHEHREKLEAEREEQRQIREQMREEEKALREIEKAKKDAEKDEELKAAALDKAREELAQAQGKQVDRLQGLVDKLQSDLKEAIDRKARAIARAQLTRSGYVYVLSNIGTFGRDVYKIGMTRRLDPQERVDELGGAAVPFPFDVHAMIYTDDAPKLETLLHNEFGSRRKNAVNLRREFFEVTLDEIRQAVEKYRDEVRTDFIVPKFALEPEAKEYHETLVRRREETQRTAPPASWYLTRDGKQKEGPLPLPKIKALLASGVLPATAMVIREGDSKWVPARFIAEL